jgi:hypothetical protein
MKIRNGFVSNSSTSSYTCDVCGNTEAAYDLGLEDAGMYQCEHGHCFCEEDLIGPSQEERYEISPETCPICTLTHIQESTLLQYICLEHNIDIEKIKGTLRDKYSRLPRVLEYFESKEVKETIIDAPIVKQKGVRLRDYD